jgi:prepilin-type N-terminal cleavage/methylation domain-containing protein
MRHRQCSDWGFTLVELMIVVVILAILAALVLPRFASADLDARAAAASANARNIQVKIEEYSSQNGAWPATPDPNWFKSGTLPKNPFAPEHEGDMVRLEVGANAAFTHPTVKFHATTGVYWYNPANGRFRALVDRQSTNALTLALYNQTNNCTLTSMVQTTD